MECCLARLALAIIPLLAIIFTQFFTAATGFDPSDFIKTSRSGPVVQSIDLLVALGLYNTTLAGISPWTPRPIPNMPPKSFGPAYSFQGKNRTLRLPPPALAQVDHLLGRSTEFTISAWLRQEMGNVGTVFSITQGRFRYLEFQSSGRVDDIRLHYTSRVNHQVYTESFPYRLADDEWHHVAISVSGSQVELLIDCQSIYKRLLKWGEPTTDLTADHQIWVGQRDSEYFFQGGMMDLQLIAGTHGHLALCPAVDATCPTCGQFTMMQGTLKDLSKQLLELTQRLVEAESRLGKVEQCECQKSCRVNDTIKYDGATWQQGCNNCSCVHGEVNCKAGECPVRVCKNPINKTGECCPICMKNCMMNNKMYEHGEVVNVKQCVDCECQDGSMNCRTFKAELCPKLKCPLEDQITVEGECCKVCQGVDYCAKGHNCHGNATCLNLQTTYTCRCDQGFRGDGHSCNDVNECQQEGDQGGHHCHSNTRCVNTIGSYICECLEGYRRLDKYNCIEVDECAAAAPQHNCHAHARCVNTQGSYHCVCAEGWSGDGYACKPLCSQSCLNGGTCSAPDTCACASGYTGDSCERDLDECATGTHRCLDERSVCVNMIGWYYCKCRPGFHSALEDNYLGTLCEDIDECEKGKHTCHNSAKCVNTVGSFECHCSEDSENCRHSCMLDNKEVLNGTSIRPEGQPCRTCTCTSGVLSCRDPLCDCAASLARYGGGSAIDNHCCPQCNSRLACTHQELNHVRFMHGEKWSYQCQTCECLYGTVDCLDMKCPPLPCRYPTKKPDACCAQCEDGGDPCNVLVVGGGSGPNDTALVTSGVGCPYYGHMYESGARFLDPADPCVNCKCKVPFCAQLVSNVACCVHRTGYFAAVITWSVALLMALVQYVPIRWGTQQPPPPPPPPRHLTVHRCWLASWLNRCVRHQQTALWMALQLRLWWRDLRRRRRPHQRMRTRRIVSDNRKKNVELREM